MRGQASIGRRSFRLLISGTSPSLGRALVGLVSISPIGATSDWVSWLVVSVVVVDNNTQDKDHGNIAAGAAATHHAPSTSSRPSRECPVTNTDDEEDDPNCTKEKLFCRLSVNKAANLAEVELVTPSHSH